MKEYGDIDSKFRYVILVSKRAKQLLKGAKPKIKSKAKNFIRIAQEEVEKGLIDFELVKHRIDDLHDVEDGIFIGEELIEEREPDRGLFKPEKFEPEPDESEPYEPDEEETEEELEFDSDDEEEED